MDNEYKAMSLFGFAMLPDLVILLHRKRLLSDQEVLDLFENSLLNLEKNQALLGSEDSAPVLRARELLEDAIRELRGQPTKS